MDKDNCNKCGSQDSSKACKYPFGCPAKDKAERLAAMRRENEALRAKLQDQAAKG